MELPEEPFRCEICRKKTMVYTKDRDDVTKVGIFALLPNKSKPDSYLCPPTAFCERCGQIKFFLEIKDTLTK